MTSLSSLTSSTSNSSTTSTSTSSVSSGIGGLVSGLDVDSLVKSLSSASQSKIDSQNQKLQKLQWKQDAYRTIISAMQDFQSSYLDILSSTYLGSASTFNTTAATSSSSAVTVSATANSSAGSFVINSITQLATAQTAKSASTVSAGLTGTVSVDSIEADLTSDSSALAGKSISLTLDGKVKAITFDDNFIESVKSDGLVTALQNKIDTAFGATGSSDRVITVSEDSSGMLSFAASGSTMKISSIGNDTATVQALGFSSGQSNKISSSSQLSELSLSTGLDSSVSTYKFSINGVDFEFANTVSLSKVINTVNASDAGVTLSYSNITDKFTIAANDTGAGDNIDIADTSGNLMTAFGLTTEAGASVTAGQNAILTVDGQQITRSSNNITVNNVTVNLQSTSSTATTVTMKADSSSLKDMITKFVDDYNTLISLVNTSITEKADSDYQPLTDAQKEEMTDDQIEKWETKAKAGVLNGDTTLRSISSKLQQLMYSSAVKGGISLADLGITSAGYDENGKLEIDKDKLNTALSTKSNQITELFTSSTGLASQMKDIFNGAIKTSGARGSRGSLVDLAGVEDTSSATQNSLYDQIASTEDLIDVLNDRLTAEQKRLWNKFSAMESALSSLNSQSSMLSMFTSS